MRNVYTIAILLVSLSVSLSLSDPNYQPEDAKLNFTELGKKYGHSVEEFDVVTEDGYITTLFHIPGKRRGPILLMHGILDSADTYVIRGKLSLAITLADNLHDVWIGNTRGNKYARRHKKLDPDGSKFWNFSFHEAGYYDLPAIIDFILYATGEKSIRTIGHSQGTTIHFVLFSTRPEYNDKVKGFIALAPVAFLSNLEPPVFTATELWPLLDDFMKSLHVEEIFRDHSSSMELIDLICSQGIISYDICYLIFVSPFSGYDPKRIEPDFWEVAIGHNPVSTSRKSVLHFVQVALNKRFAYFDDSLGYISAPPSYDLGSIRTNVTLIVSSNDALSRVKDVDFLRSMLPKETMYHLMEPPKWSHLDFVWANDMDVYLYPYLLSRLQDYE